MKATYPIWIHGLSPAEVQHIAKVSRLTARGGAAPADGRRARLDPGRRAPRSSPTACGGSSASPRARPPSGSRSWRRPTASGMRTTATMMFGHVETLEERIDHLLHLRDLQDRTGGFTAFIGWTFQPENTAMAGDELTSFQYLRTLAVVARLPRQLPERPGLVGDPGLEDRPGVAALRRQRLRQPDDRGERGLRRRRALPADRGRDRARHPGGRLRPQAPHDGLQDRGRPVLLEPRDARRCPKATRPRRRSPAS